MLRPSDNVSAMASNRQEILLAEGPYTLACSNRPSNICGNRPGTCLEGIDSVLAEMHALAAEFSYHCR